MQLVTCFIKHINWMFQRRQISERRIEVRINNTKHKTKMASILRSVTGIWYYFISSNEPYWNERSTELTSEAKTHDEAFNQMLQYLRNEN